MCVSWDMAVFYVWHLRSLAIAYHAQQTRRYRFPELASMVVCDISPYAVLPKLNSVLSRWALNVADVMLAPPQKHQALILTSGLTALQIHPKVRQDDVGTLVGTPSWTANMIYLMSRLGDPVINWFQNWMWIFWDQSLLNFFDPERPDRLTLTFHSSLPLCHSSSRTVCFDKQ